jgi:spermidine synthase
VGSASTGLALRRIDRPAALVGVLAVAGGLLTLALVPMLNHLPVLYVALRGHLPVGFHLFQVAVLGLCFAYALLPTLPLGGLLAAAVEWAGRRGEGSGAAAGRLYAANTIGNIAGTVAAGIVLIPLLGFEHTLELGAAILIGTGLFTLGRERAFPRRHRILAPASVLLAVALFVVARPPLDILALSCGVFQLKSYTPESGSSVLRFVRSGRRLLFTGEDAAAFVSVDEVKAEQTRSLRVNGKVDASNRFDMANQKLISHIPLLLHRDPRKALLIGFGSGISAYSALRHSLEKLDCVEISSQVILASRLFLAENHGVAGDPRLKLSIDDARAFVERSRERYDVIVSEPSNPWIAGVSNLFTREFFATLKTRLAPGGVMTQWLQTYSLDEETFRMLGSEDPLEPDFDDLPRRMSNREVAADLATLGVTGPLLILGHQLVAAEDSVALAGTGPLHTDDRPILEYLAPEHLYVQQVVAVAEDRYRIRSDHNWVRRYLRERPVDRRTMVEFFRYFGDDYDGQILLTLAREMVEQAPEDPQMRALLAEALERFGDLTAALAQIERAARGAPGAAPLQKIRFRIAQALEGRDLSFFHPPKMETTLEAAMECVRLEPDNPEHQLNLGTTRFRRQEWAMAHGPLSRGVDLARAQGNPKSINLGYYILLACDGRSRAGDASGALVLLAAARELGPKLLGPHAGYLAQLERQLESSRPRK